MVQAAAVRKATPARWQMALARALAGNYRMLTDVAGESAYVFAAGGDGTLYHTDGVSCDCQAGQHDDPVCKHRALFWHAQGLLEPVIDPDRAELSRLEALNRAGRLKTAADFRNLANARARVAAK